MPEYTQYVLGLLGFILFLTLIIVGMALRKALRAAKQAPDSTMSQPGASAAPQPQAPGIPWQIKFHFFLLWLAIVYLVNQIATLHNELIFLRVVLSP